MNVIKATVYAFYQHPLFVAVFTFLRGLTREGDLIHFWFYRGKIIREGGLI